jgi:hypothetical protein
VYDCQQCRHTCFHGYPLSLNKLSAEFIYGCQVTGSLYFCIQISKMKISNIDEFLADRKFDEGLQVRLNFDRERKTRIRKITELSTGKRLIHVGCVDHMPIIEEKIRNNTWLHKLVTEAASECIGVDINKEGIEFMHKIEMPIMPTSCSRTLIKLPAASGTT